MKYTVTYTLEVTDILDSECASEKDLANLDLDWLAEIAAKELLVDNVVVRDYKYFVHDGEGGNG